jgi:CRAL/TRIO domain
VEDFTLQEQTGKLRFFGKAIDQSDILIFTAQRQEEIKSNDEITNNLRFIIYTIEKGRKENGIDKITLLMDMNKARYSKNEVKLASNLIPILQKHYPDTLSRCYLFPTNGIFWMTYSASKYFLDKNTITKIRLKESAAPLNEWISRDQFYFRFGGSVVEEMGFEGADKKFDSKGEQVLKSNPIIEVEEIFIAPLEYQSV